MLVAAPTATLVAVVMGGLVLWSVSRYVGISRRLSERTVKARERVAQHLTERHGTWRLIKLFDAQEFERKEIEKQTGGLYSLNIELALATGMIQLIVFPLQVLFALVAVYIGIELLGLAVGTITVFFVILVRLMPILSNFANLRQTVAIIDTVLTRVLEVVTGANQNQETAGGTREFHEIGEKISFENVSFHYPHSGGAALDGVSVDIPAGKTTAITGRTGAGKSTFVDLIPRLIVPQRGTIRFDGQPATAFSLVSLRREIAFVTQSPFNSECKRVRERPIRQSGGVARGRHRGMPSRLR